jgi:hypothetical protein
MNKFFCYVFVCILDMILENVGDFIFVEQVALTTTTILLCFSHLV